jgi:hypothetical protein
MLFNRKSLSRALVLGALFAMAGAVPPALADTQTQAIGNTSGAPFNFHCPAGQALIGWNYNATDHLTLIAPMCQEVEFAGEKWTVVGAPPTSPASGFGAEDPGAKSGEPITCPDNGIMQRLSVFVTATLRVHHIRATCQAIGHPTTLIKSTATSGGASTANSEVKCETRTSYATGIFGTYNKSLAKGGIMSLGLNCFSGDKPQQDAADTGDDDGNGDAAGDQGDADQANADDGGDDGNGGFPNQLEINIGPDGVSLGAGGGKGKTRILKEASTLYSDKGNTEIAYFDKGDKVVVTACENKGQGWCQVAKPQRGLIWGGDLK